MFEESVIIKGLLEETVKAGLQVQQTLQDRGREAEMKSDDTTAVCIRSGTVKAPTVVTADKS